MKQIEGRVLMVLAEDGDYVELPKAMWELIHQDIIVIGVPSGTAPMKLCEAKITMPDLLEFSEEGVEFNAKFDFEDFPELRTILVMSRGDDETV